MIARINRLRVLMLALALLMFAANIQAVRAECCGVKIDNQTDCTFTICITTQDAIKCVTIKPGKNVFDLPRCPDPVLEFTDACTGEIVKFPGDARCRDVRVSKACCIHVCVGQEPCTLVITPGNCSKC